MHFSLLLLKQIVLFSKNYNFRHTFISAVYYLFMKKEAQINREIIEHKFPKLWNLRYILKIEHKRREENLSKNLIKTNQGTAQHVVFRILKKI